MHCATSIIHVSLHSAAAMALPETFVEISSLVRDCNAYMNIWVPVINEELHLRWKPGYMEDARTIAVKKGYSNSWTHAKLLAKVVFFKVMQQWSCR